MGVTPGGRKLLLPAAVAGAGLGASAVAVLPVVPEEASLMPRSASPLASSPPNAPGLPPAPASAAAFVALPAAWA
jgi:hypothetical protein